MVILRRPAQAGHNLSHSMRFYFYSRSIDSRIVGSDSSILGKSSTEPVTNVKAACHMVTWSSLQSGATAQLGSTLLNSPAKFGSFVDCCAFDQTGMKRSVGQSLKPDLSSR